MKPNNREVRTCWLCGHGHYATPVNDDDLNGTMLTMKCPAYLHSGARIEVRRETDEEEQVVVLSSKRVTCGGQGGVCYVEAHSDDTIEWTVDAWIAMDEEDALDGIGRETGNPVWQKHTVRIKKMLDIVPTMLRAQSRAPRQVTQEMKARDAAARKELVGVVRSSPYTTLAFIKEALRRS